MLAVYSKFNALDFNSGVYSLSHRRIILDTYLTLPSCFREKEMLVLCENVSWVFLWDQWKPKEAGVSSELSAKLTFTALFVITEADHVHQATGNTSRTVHRCVNTTEVLVDDASSPFFLCLTSLQITLAVCFILMFGNSMLLTSFYASSLVSIWVS